MGEQERYRARYMGWFNEAVAFLEDPPSEETQPQKRYEYSKQQLTGLSISAWWFAQQDDHELKESFLETAHSLTEIMRESNGGDAPVKERSIFTAIKESFPEFENPHQPK